MRVIAILGSLGSGKTTLVNRLIPVFKEQGSGVLVIVNDVGETNIDAQRLMGVAEISALTAGCIGCSDLPAFLRVLEKARENAQLDVVLIEPTGIADGWEIMEASHQAQLPVQALTLVDVEHFDRNRALSTMESQLQVADLVAYSWFSDDQEAPEHVLDFVGRHAPGVPVVRVSLAETYLLEALQSSKRTTCSHGHHECLGHHDHAHGHHHDHDHHEHSHGVYPYSVSLENFSWVDVVALIGPYTESLIRAKGVVASATFDYVQGSIQQGALVDEGTESFGNFIFTKPMPAFAEMFSSLPRKPVMSKKEVLRSGEGISLSDTLAAIEWQLDSYPAVITSDGRVRSDCEADVAYQLAKREGVPTNIWHQALHKFVSWRIEAFSEVRLRQVSGIWDVRQDSLRYCQSRLGMNLAWHAQTYGDFLSPEILLAIAELHPAHNLLEALEYVSRLSFDEEIAEERPEIILTVIRFGLLYERLDRKEALRIVKHLESLAAPELAWQDRWREVARSLELEGEVQ